MHKTKKLKLITKFTNLDKNQAQQLLDLCSNHDNIDELLYNTIGMLNSGITFDQVFQDYTNNKINWDSYIYKPYQIERHFDDTILAKPPEVREGENECPKCHQKKTLVVEMQTRSADEGYTYYIHCFNPTCKAITR